MKKKTKKSTKRRRMLRLPGIMLLSMVFAFSGLFGSLPLIGGDALTSEAKRYIEPEKKETQVVTDEIFNGYLYSTKEPIRVYWNVYAGDDGPITDKLTADHCIFTLNGTVYKCSKANDYYYLDDNSALISEPGEYSYTIRFRGDQHMGYQPSEYQGKLTVVEKKDFVVTFSIPDSVPVGQPLPLSGTLTDNNGDPVAGVSMGLWVTGPEFNEVDEWSAVTDKNGVWTYSGTKLTPAQSGDYHLENMWVTYYDLNEYNTLRFRDAKKIQAVEGLSLDSFDWLEVNTDTVRKTYVSGEAFDTSGLEVRGHFTDRNGYTYDKDLSDGGYQVIPGRLTEGCASVTIAYSVFGQTRTAEIPVTVTGNGGSGTANGNSESVSGGGNSGSAATGGNNVSDTNVINKSSDPGRESGTGSVSDTRKVSDNGASKEVTNKKLPVVSGKKLTAGKRSMTVRWTKLTSDRHSKVSGIEIQYSTKKSFPQNRKLTKTGTVKKTAKSVKIKKLKSKKTYWVRMRTFKKVNGVKHVGKWTKAKKIRIK